MTETDGDPPINPGKAATVTADQIGSAAVASGETPAPIADDRIRFKGGLVPGILGHLIENDEVYDDDPAEELLPGMNVDDPPIPTPVEPIEETDEVPIAPPTAQPQDTATHLYNHLAGPSGPGPTEIDMVNPNPHSPVPTKNEGNGRGAAAFVTMIGVTSVIGLVVAIGLRKPAVSDSVPPPPPIVHATEVVPPSGATPPTAPPRPPEIPTPSAETEPAPPVPPSDGTPPTAVVATSGPVVTTVVPDATTPIPVVIPVAKPVAAADVPTPKPAAKPIPVAAIVPTPKPIPVAPKAVAVVAPTPPPVTAAASAPIPEKLVVSATGKKPACKAACSWGNVDPADGFPYTVNGTRTVTCGNVSYTVGRWKMIEDGGKQNYCFTVGKIAEDPAGP